ncbi:DUF2639 domain-containing protein [Anoxybacteroides rupiense]|uniref:DUF2639 domain-containing protein n=1 Tax=Anoxybacteroides rupiense TaxID=311460 RepID=UPI002E1BC13A
MGKVAEKERRSFYGPFWFKRLACSTLKDIGIRRHPIGQKKVEAYKASVLYGLYQKYAAKRVDPQEKNA